MCPAFDVKNLREASVKAAIKALRVMVHALGYGGHRHINESRELVDSWTFLTAYNTDLGIFTSQNPLHNAILFIRLPLEQHEHPLVLTTPACTCRLCHEKYSMLIIKVGFQRDCFHRIFSDSRHYFLFSIMRKEGKVYKQRGKLWCFRLPTWIYNLFTEGSQNMP